MNADAQLSELAHLCGILDRFYDLSGHEYTTSVDTMRALLTADGVDVSNPSAVTESLKALHAEANERWFPLEVIVTAEEERRLDFGLGAEWVLSDTETSQLVAEGRATDAIHLSALAPGVYDLRAAVSGRVEHVRVLAAPHRLPMLEEVAGQTKNWGLNAALYGFRSVRNSGLGDFRDLAAVSQVIGGKGGAFLGVNPMHNMGFADIEAISPYSPSHRGFYNTSYIALDAVHGLSQQEIAEVLSDFTNEIEALKSGSDVKYAAHKRMHNRALELLFERFETLASDSARSGFDAFILQSGEDLDRFSEFEDQSEQSGPDWRAWSGKTTTGRPDRVRFHKWLQWQADVQLGEAQSAARAAGMPLGLYLDLAVGPRRGGAESWCEKDAIAQGVSVGAPPDHLSPEGQNWDLAAFAPRKLQAQNYRALRHILSHTMRHAGAVRIDHVLGLNRSFWIPDEDVPGGYIRQPFEALIAIIKIEAARHGTVVIGEDLGLVPDGFRETMRGHGFYGYSVLQYEKMGDGRFRSPKDAPTQALACFATHDTPTVKGYEVGRDIDWWEKLGWTNGRGAAEARETRHHDVAQLRALQPDQDDFTNAVHSALASGSAAMVAVQLDDILAEPEAQNLPGTVEEHPNWRRVYPHKIEDMAALPALGLLDDMMKSVKRSSKDEDKEETSDEN